MRKERGREYLREANTSQVCNVDTVVHCRHRFICWKMGVEK